MYKKHAAAYFDKVRTLYLNPASGFYNAESLGNRHKVFDRRLASFASALPSERKAEAENAIGFLTALNASTEDKLAISHWQPKACKYCFIFFYPSFD